MLIPAECIEALRLAWELGIAALCLGVGVGVGLGAYLNGA